MKQQILFIQGGGEGAYEEDGYLVASLRSTLGDVYELYYPQMPNESDPDYEPWKVQIKQELAGLEDEVILIGHSLGSSFLLKYLAEEKIEKPIIRFAQHLKNRIIETQPLLAPKMSSGRSSRQHKLAALKRAQVASITRCWSG